jgi:hypothetical protein
MIFFFFFCVFGISELLHEDCGENTHLLFLDLFLGFQLNNREPIIYPEFIFLLKIFSLGKYFMLKQSVLNYVNAETEIFCKV